MKRSYNKEEEAVKDLLKSLRFDASSVDLRIMKDFQITAGPVGWMPIAFYSLTKDVLKKIEQDGNTPVSPFEFITAVSKLDKIIGVKVCLFKFGELRWISLIAIENTQRTISSILSGDGYAPNCEFAVKPAPSL